MKALQANPLRAAALSVAMASIVMAGSVRPVSAAPNGNALAQIFSAEFTVGCDTFVVSSSKDLSNVVLLFADGRYQKFDGLNQPEGSFSGTGDNLGQPITTAYVKSGRFKQKVVGIEGKVGAQFDCLVNQPR